MNSKPRIAVIGGTGKSGTYLTDQLISLGYRINMLLRHPETFPINNPLINIVKGDARDFSAIRLLIQDCQAVVSTLGQPIGEPSIFSDACNNVLRAIGECHTSRYIVTTGLNVATESDCKSEKVRLATEWMYQNYPKTTLDRQLEYQLLSQSTADWTLIRLPLIEQTAAIGPILVNEEDCPGYHINAGSLAQFMIDQLWDPRYYRKAPFIASA